MIGRSTLSAVAAMDDDALAAFACREPQAFADLCTQVVALGECAQMTAADAAEVDRECDTACARLWRALDRARLALHTLPAGAPH